MINELVKLQSIHKLHYYLNRMKKIYTHILEKGVSLKFKINVFKVPHNSE